MRVSILAAVSEKVKLFLLKFMYCCHLFDMKHVAPCSSNLLSKVAAGCLRSVALPGASSMWARFGDMCPRPAPPTRRKQSPSPDSRREPRTCPRADHCSYCCCLPRQQSADIFQMSFRRL